MAEMHPCPRCNGAGRTFNHSVVTSVPCYVCDGVGKENPKENPKEGRREFPFLFDLLPFKALKEVAGMFYKGKTPYPNDPFKTLPLEGPAVHPHKVPSLD